MRLRLYQKYNLAGPKGDSLFSSPFKYPSGKKKGKEIGKKLDSYLEKYRETSDDRAWALVGALAIENELDNFLSKWIKDYKHIADRRDFTFSFKVDLATSSKLIPKKILNAIEPIRKIRNIFAHHLDIDTFEKAKEFDSKSKKSSFSMLHNKVKMFTKPWSAEDDRLSDDYLSYQQLTIAIILGLNAYAKLLTKVQDHIWKPENLHEIMKSRDI